MMVKRLLRYAGVALALGFAVPASVQAGNLWLTGHDADLHCAFGQQCNHYGVALNLGRTGAPTPSLPMLFLDSGTELATAAGMSGAKAKNSVEGAGNPFLFTVVDPSTAAFSALALSTSAFSAIVIASDSSCGGCDNDINDINAINARSADIASFFNAGGGLVYFSGAGNRATYYNSVPIPAAAAAVSAPFTLTPAGIAVGLIGGTGSSSDTNCCATHNSFSLPGAGSALQVAETDSAGLAETLFATSAIITDGGIVTPGGPSAPEPSTLALLGIAIAALGLRRRRHEDS